MKKAVYALLLCLPGSAFAFIDSSKSMTYTGSGKWATESGRTGEHKIKIATQRVDSKKVKVTFEAKDQGGTDRYTWLAEFNDGGAFNMKMGDKSIGSGRCTGSQCSYKFSYLNGTFEETLDLQNDTIIRTGSKTVEGGKISWFDHLSKH